MKDKFIGLRVTPEQYARVVEEVANKKLTISKYLEIIIDLGLASPVFVPDKDIIEKLGNDVANIVKESFLEAVKEFGA